MRLFVAVNFTEEFKNTIIEYRNKLREFKDDPHINWTTDENLHLTLAFIGEYKDADKVKAALDTVGFKPFTIKTNGCGNFGSLRWVGITENAVKLSDKVRMALDEFEIPYDEKPMKPHVTVERNDSRQTSCEYASEGKTGGDENYANISHEIGEDKR